MLMNEDKNSLGKTTTNFSALSESSGSFRLTQEYDIDNLYNTDEIEDRSTLNPNYKIEKTTKFNLLHKSADRPFHTRSYKGSIDDKKKVFPEKLCTLCIKYIQMIEELKNHQRIQSEKILHTEKHLKQYDNLLQIKDNRLSQQESALKTDVELLEIEKDKLSKEKKKFEEDKVKFLRKQEILELENERIENDINELNKKHEEFQVLVEEFEIRKEELMIREEKQEFLEKEYNEKIMISREQDIQRLLEEAHNYKSDKEASPDQKTDNIYILKDALQEKKLKLKQKKENLKQLAQELFELKEKLENDQKNNFQEFEERFNLLAESEQKLKEEKAYIQETELRINEELESIDQLKAILHTQEENLENEKKFMQESYQKKLDELEDMKKTIIKNPFTGTESKERLSECSAFSITEITDLSFARINDNNDLIKEYELKYSNLKRELEYIENKLKIVECSREEVESNNEELNQIIDELQAKNEELKAKISNLEKLLQSDERTLRKDYDSINIKYNQLEGKNHELESKISSLEKKLHISSLKIEDQEIEAANYINELEKYKDLNQDLQVQLKNHQIYAENPDFFTSKVKELSLELEKKLEIIKQKEKELEELQDIVIIEKNSIEKDAELIKSINEDLNLQKKNLYEERENFEKKKTKLLTMKGKLFDNSIQGGLIEKDSLALLKKQKTTAARNTSRNMIRQTISPYSKY